MVDPAASRVASTTGLCLRAVLALRGDNVVIEQASTLPLPALLPHMTALVSLMSGAAGEAAIFGVPAFFLSDEAAGPFGNLIARGCARVVDPVELVPEIEKLSEPRRPEFNQPSLTDTLRSLEKIARWLSRSHCQLAG